MVIWAIPREPQTAPTVVLDAPTIRANSRRIAVELWQDGNGWILLTVAAGWFLSVGVRFTYPSVLPFFRADLGFGLTVAGFLISGLWFAYALGQFPGGILGDRIGEGTILVISTAVSAVAVLLVAAATEVWLLFVATIAFGFATSLYGPTRFTIFTDIYDHRAGTAVGISHAAGSIGNTVLPVGIAAIAGYATWRAGYGLLVPLFVVITVALWIAVPAKTGKHGGQSTARGLMETGRLIARSIFKRGIPIVVAVQIILQIASQGFLGFYPTYLVEVKGFTPQLAAILFGAYFAIGILIQPVTGLCMDRFGSRVTLGGLGVAFFSGLVALYFATSVWHILLLTVLLSHRNGTGVVTNTFIADALHGEVKGAGLGLLRTTWLFIGATSPILVGVLGDSGLLAEAFLGLAALVGIAAALCIFIPDR